MSSDTIRSPLQGISNQIQHRERKTSDSIQQIRRNGFGVWHQPKVGHATHHTPRMPNANRESSVANDGSQNANRLPGSNWSLQETDHKWSSVGPAATTSTASSSEIPIRHWLKLPQSQYGIRYELGVTSTMACMHRLNGISILQMAASKSPFELRMQQLRNILQTEYPRGASLIYVREIFEPGDSDYTFPNSHSGPPNIEVAALTIAQVDRLRLMVVDVKRQAVLISYLSVFEMLPFNAAINVVDQFGKFKFKYSKIRDCRVKFNELFCFTYAIQRFDGWIHSTTNGEFGRQKVVEGLALRWKNLLKERSPKDLGIDEEFSYPAVIALLQTFKKNVESIRTWDEPRLVFRYM